MRWLLLLGSLILVMAVITPAGRQEQATQCGLDARSCVRSVDNTIPPSAAHTMSLPLVMRPDSLSFYAFYYLWWSRAHWEAKLGSDYPWDGSWPLPGKVNPTTGCGASPSFVGSTLVDVPIDGAYDQLESSIFATHVGQAAQAGLSGFLAAWQGTGLADEQIEDSGYNRRLDRLIQTIRAYNAAAGDDFHYIVDYETFKELRTPEQIGNDIDYLLAHYGDDPAWGRMRGRLIFYWHDTKSFPTATLQAIHERFADRLFIIGEERATTWTAERALYLEGTGFYWSTQDPYRNPESFDQLRSFAARVHADGRLWFAPLAPGYNDELSELALGNHPGPADCVARKDRQTLRILFEGNRASSPDGWFVISWNEWVEHTYIEPSKRYGSIYLKELTQIIADTR